MIVRDHVTETVDRGRVTLVGSRHPAAATMSARLAIHLPVGARVLVATSGGRDSMSMLVLSLALQDRRTPAILVPTAAHIDHGLRAESGEEAAFLRDLADALEVPFVSKRLDWPVNAGRVSSESAREARWEALDRLAEACGANAVIAAHHADDQAETLLMRLARGTGLAGLTGIPERRPLASGRPVVRPLLGCTRSMLATIVEEAGLPWIDDPTNHDRSRPRERLRHEVIPALEAIHPGAARHLAALARECVAAEEDPGDVTLAESDAWDRGTCRRLDPIALAGRIRESAGRAGVVEVSAIPRTVWETAASMVRDDDPRPRQLSLGPSHELVVHRNVATIRAVRPAPESDA